MVWTGMEERLGTGRWSPRGEGQAQSRRFRERTQVKARRGDCGSRCWSQAHHLFPHGHDSCLCLGKMDPALGLSLLVDLTKSSAGSGAGPEEGQVSTGP